MIRRALLAATLVGFALWPGCVKEKKTPTGPPPPEAAFVGSRVCQGCHASEYAAFEASGHPNILTAVAGGQMPGAPLSLPDNPPAGLSWSDVHYVIGGFAWKALFVQGNQQILTGTGTQYDLPNSRFPDPIFADYTSPATYNYACFRCHTAGADSASNTFQLAGVQCESCHGPASLHVATLDTSKVTVDRSAEACGRCHTPSLSQTRVLATVNIAGSDTTRFISDYQQYAELKAGPHAGLACTTCHDPHRGVYGSQVGGIIKTCTDCHAGVVSNHPSNAPTCIDCHMPYAGLSARTANKYTADVRSHLFRIHVGPENLTSGMYETAGANVAVKQGYGLGLGYVCYTCHKDEQGRGGQDDALTMGQILAEAPQIHGR